MHRVYMSTYNLYTLRNEFFRAVTVYTNYTPTCKELPLSLTVCIFTIHLVFLNNYFLTNLIMCFY